ncbi:MAG: hypothetical protein ACRD1E_10330, partial [Terriglobales bacterium]
PRIVAQYRINLDAAQARRISGIAALPAGMAAVAGTLDYRSQPGSTMLASLAAAGTFSSRELRFDFTGARTAGLRIAVEGLSGRFRFAQGYLAVSQVRARALGGTVAGDLAWRNVGGARAPATFTGSLRGAQLQNLVRLGAGGDGAATLGQLGISGVMNAAVQGGWAAQPNEVEIAAQAALDASLRQPARVLPVIGQADVLYRPRSGVLSVNSSSLRTPKSWLRASGTVAAAAQLQIAAGSTDLAEVEAIADQVAVALGRQPPRLGLGGAGSLSASASGRLDSPEIEAAVTLAPLAIRGSNWRSAQATIAADRQRLAVRRLELLAGTQGQIGGSFSIGLQNWSVGSSSALGAQISASHLALGPLQELIGRALPVAGILQAQLDLAGTLRHPTGHGTATLAPGQIEMGGQAEAIRSATLGFEGTEAAIAGTLTAQLPAGTVQAHGSFIPRTGAYQATLSAEGLALEQFDSIAGRKLPVSGKLRLEGTGAGTLAQPAFHLSVTSPEIMVAGQPIRQVQVQAQLAGQAITADASASTLDTLLKGKARIGLSDGLPLEASLDSTAVPLAPLLVAYAPGLAQQLRGQTALHATVSGPLRRLDELQARLEL